MKQDGAGSAPARRNDGLRLAERLSFWLPLVISIGFSLVFFVGRFITLLSEDLKEPPHGLAPVLMLLVIVGAVTFLAVGLCAIVGAGVGLLLCAAVQAMWARRSPAGTRALRTAHN
jgi:hypothetical protein